jgi:hypothetical protein
LVLVPSLHDVGLTDVLPRPPLPATVLERLRAKVTHLVLASNPCRYVPPTPTADCSACSTHESSRALKRRGPHRSIRFCTKEMVLFREELVNKLRRNCVLPPSDPSLSLAQQAVRTVVDSAHLSPLSLSVRPIYWGLDHTLRLFPLPHAVRAPAPCHMGVDGGPHTGPHPAGTGGPLRPVRGAARRVSLPQPRPVCRPRLWLPLVLSCRRARHVWVRARPSPTPSMVRH